MLRPIARRIGFGREYQPPLEKRNMEAINLERKFELVKDLWNPQIIAELNDTYIKAVKLKGEFVWHHHDDEDELFLVMKGRLLMRFRDRDVTVSPGEFIIVPKGVEHLPVADEEVHLVLVEPKTTLNTGNIRNEKTVERLQRI